VHNYHFNSSNDISLRYNDKYILTKLVLKQYIYKVDLISFEMCCVFISRIYVAVVFFQNGLLLSMNIMFTNKINYI